MKRQVRILRKAQADLLEIQRYTVRESAGDVGQVVGGLLTAIERLGRFPESGPVVRDERLRRAGYRYLLQGWYIIFYKLIGAHVRIYRVLHQRRAYERLL
jgi:plasmid stabilization system protein ParE